MILRASALSLATATLLLAGCRQDMHDQPKFIPQRGSSFFADGRSVRYQVTGTVSRSQGDENSYFATGMTNGTEGDGMPVAVTPQLLERGQERFNIYCTPCHSRVGDGRGMIVQRGYYQAANFHTERLRQASLGHFFSVITNGYGAMPEYHAELAPIDRWAVVAYIRALQLSQHASDADAPTGSQFRNLGEIAETEGLPASIIENGAPRPIATPPAPAVPAEIPAAQTSTTAAPAVNGTTAAAKGGPAATPGNPATPVSAAPASAAQKEAAPAGQTEVASAQAPKPAEAAAPAAGNAAAGKQIYTDNCMMCHQANRGGMPPMIPSLVDIVTRTSAGHVRETVTTGVPTAKPPMPSFANKLSSTDIDNLIAYLRTKP